MKMKLSEAIKKYEYGEIEILSCDDDLGIALCGSMSIDEYHYYIYTSVFGGDILAACVRAFSDKEKAENAYNALVAV